MTECGWFKVPRGWRDHEVLKGEFDRGSAWLWLVEHAAWRSKRILIKGEMITLNRGELSYSVRFLADKWGWSKSRVDRFLANLRAESMIAMRSKTGTFGEPPSGTTPQQIAGQGQSIITILNYDKYQSSDDPSLDNDGKTNGTTRGTTNGMSAGRARYKEEEGKKERISSSNQPTSPPCVNGLEDAPAGRIPDGWTAEDFEKALEQVVDAAGLALTPSKRKAARTVLACWLDGWQGEAVALALQNSTAGAAVAEALIGCSFYGDGPDHLPTITGADTPTGPFQLQSARGPHAVTLAALRRGYIVDARDPSPLAPPAGRRHPAPHQGRRSGGCRPCQTRHSPPEVDQR